VNGLNNAQILAGLAGLLLAYGAFFAWIVPRFDRLEERFDAKIDRLDEKFSGEFRAVYAKIDRLDEKFSGEFRTVYAKIESLTIAVSRLEGAVYRSPLQKESQ
jgi:hypothetical protein